MQYQRLRVTTVDDFNHGRSRVVHRYVYGGGAVARLWTKLTGEYGAPASNETLLVDELQPDTLHGLLSADLSTLTMPDGSTQVVQQIESLDGTDVLPTTTSTTTSA